MPAEIFLNNLLLIEDSDEAADYLYDAVHNWLVDKNYASIDWLLATIKVEDISVGLARSFCVLTHKHKEHFAYRDAFKHKAYLHACKIRGEDVATRLFR